MIYLNHVREYLNNDMSPGLKIWDDKSISPGSRWDNEIKRNLQAADIIVVLISKSFIDSAYINAVEVKQALDREKAGGCIIIPVFARACPLNTPLALEIAAFQGYPKYNDKKRTFLSEMEEDKYTHLTDLYNGVLDAVDTIKKKREIEKSRPAAGKANASQETMEKLRSNRNIFLALPGPDGLLLRNNFFYDAMVKKEIEQWPFDILPDIMRVQTMEDIRKFPADAVVALIDQCIYTIHIFSSPEELAGGTVRDQLGQAMRHNNTGLFSRSIIWLRSDKLEESLDQELMGFPRVIGKNNEKIYEIIDGFEVQRKKKLKELESAVFAPNLKMQMIYDYSKDHDNEFRKKIKVHIEHTKTCSIRLTTAEQKREELKQNLEKCEGAMILYGASEPSWYSIMQDLLFDAQSLKSKAVGVGNPRIEDKINSDVSQNALIVIREDGSADDFTGGLENFLNNLSS